MQLQEYRPDELYGQIIPEIERRQKETQQSREHKRDHDTIVSGVQRLTDQIAQYEADYQTKAKEVARLQLQPGMQHRSFRACALQSNCTYMNCCLRRHSSAYAIGFAVGV